MTTIKIIRRVRREHVTEHKPFLISTACRLADEVERLNKLLDSVDARVRMKVNQCPKCGIKLIGPNDRQYVCPSCQPAPQCPMMDVTEENWRGAEKASVEGE